MTDGNLRQIFRQRLPRVHWQSVENISTGQGVPDMNGCIDGAEFWVENKTATANVLSHNLTAQQVGWIERRLRAGGRVFIALRLAATSGPRRGAAVDALLLYHGSQARALALGGVAGAGKPLGRWENGPAHWDWAGIQAILASKIIR